MLQASEPVPCIAELPCGVDVPTFAEHRHEHLSSTRQEAQKQRRPLVFMQDDLPSMRAILSVSAPSRKAKSDLEEPVPASLPKLDILERQACLDG